MRLDPAARQRATDLQRLPMVVAGPNGERNMPVENLFTGYFETALAKDELIVALRVPQQNNRSAAYLKVTTGSAEDWPAVGVAVALEGGGGVTRSRRNLQRQRAESGP